MPPFRQPTPSPPPPPVTPAHSATTMSSSTSGSEGKQPSHGSSNAAGTATNIGGDAGFSIPPNFVPPPPPREVATGVSNLGNTCYMNAALQALAHAPELCHALDAESHLRRCPVALRNERRRRRRARDMAAARAGEGADGGAAEGERSPTRADGSGGKQVPDGKDGKTHRRSNSSSSNGSNGSKGKKRKKKDGSAGAVDYDPDYEYCTLCEVERLMGRVHSRPEEILDDPEEDSMMGSKDENDQGGNDAPAASPPSAPVVPETFVSGFMSKVAPWFRRGVQEDSHEFLRLLIDAMQNSCKGARNSASLGSASSSSNSSVSGKEDTEYPFRLFRGTVESNVKCSACRATSCKIDPIEDIGLDILPLKSSTPSPAASHYPYTSFTRGGASMSSSRSTSPTASVALADVQQALERFISSEHLDSGYKCEKCGKLGKATKTSKLASIPPILTLHLKRFRYGSGGGKRGGGGYSDTTRSSRSARGGAGPSSDFDNVGPSGSAKIEGHVRFSAVLDVKPYLTLELQRTVFQKAICRLFAVVVHTGKNSHSGHYVAYVHNVSKKEWWKMDDAKIVRVSWNEVQNAEAYMLFYRVTSHPVATRLKDIVDAKEEKARRVMGEIKRRDEAAKAAVEAEARAAEEAKKAEAAAAAAKATAVALQDMAEKDEEEEEGSVPDASPASDAEDPNAVTPDVSLGKRARPPMASGEEWVRAATTLSHEYLPLFARIQEFITDNVTFSPEFFGYVTEEYNRMSSRLSIGRRVKTNKRIKTLLGKGPGGVYPPADVQGGAEDVRGGILDLFHQVAIMHKKRTEKESFLLPKIEEEGEEDVVDAKAPTTTDAAVAMAAAAPPEVVPALTIDNDLIIPADNTESYDGAL